MTYVCKESYSVLITKYRGPKTEGEKQIRRLCDRSGVVRRGWTAELGEGLEVEVRAALRMTPRFVVWTTGKMEL